MAPSLHLLGSWSPVAEQVCNSNVHLPPFPTELSLYNNFITFMGTSDFIIRSYVPNLERLNLRRNRITTIFSGAIKSVTRLQELDLAENRLASLTPSVFDESAALRSLKLSSNSITGLTSIIFRAQTQLETLWLDNNVLTTLPDGGFDNLVRLKSLRLDNNKITVLRKGIFDKLESLEELYLTLNGIHTVPEGLFDKNINLRVLEMKGNPSVCSVTAGQIRCTCAPGYAGEEDQTLQSYCIRTLVIVQLGGSCKFVL